MVGILQVFGFHPRAVGVALAIGILIGIGGIQQYHSDGVAFACFIGHLQSALSEPQALLASVLRCLSALQTGHQRHVPMMCKIWHQHVIKHMYMCQIHSRMKSRLAVSVTLNECKQAPEAALLPVVD